MKETMNQTCDRAEDLIAFLYRELDEKDARNFESHLDQCAGCKRELASFGEIRRSIVSWRDASLRAALAQDDRQVVVAPTRRSAFAAISEFFNLSPLWMKGVAAFASLLFCVCAVLAIAYLKKPNTLVVTAPTDKIYSQAELDKQVATAVKASEQRLRTELAAQSDVQATEGTKPIVQKKTPNRLAPMRESTYAVNKRDLRKPLTAQERKELAADLGLSTARDDDDIDLVSDKIPQAP
jgi:anti-sigma factor RsiW